MPDAVLLLYNYSPQEIGACRLLLRDLPGVLVTPVARTAWGMTISDVLAGKTPPSAGPLAEISRKMIVFANAGDAMLQLLLAVCGRISEEKPLRAVLTETNRNWTGLELYRNLLEEEMQLGG